jgi:hypothetical protein
MPITLAHGKNDKAGFFIRKENNEITELNKTFVLS